MTNLLQTKSRFVPGDLGPMDQIVLINGKRAIIPSIDVTLVLVQHADP